MRSPCQRSLRATRGHADQAAPAECRRATGQRERGQLAGPVEQGAVTGPPELAALLAPEFKGGKRPARLQIGHCAATVPCQMPMGEDPDSGGFDPCRLAGGRCRIWRKPWPAGCRPAGNDLLGQCDGSHGKTEGANGLFGKRQQVFNFRSKQHNFILKTRRLLKIRIMLKNRVRWQHEVATGSSQARAKGRAE
jgi:hypothetical protein